MNLDQFRHKDSKSPRAEAIAALPDVPMRLIITTGSAKAWGRIIDAVGSENIEGHATLLTFNPKNMSADFIAGKDALQRIDQKIGREEANIQRVVGTSALPLIPESKTAKSPAATVDLL